MTTKFGSALLLIGLSMALASGAAFGQNAPPNPQQMDPAMVQQFIDRIQQRMLDNVQNQLGSSDDEFAALKPFVQKVLTQQMVTQTARANVMMRMFAAGQGAGNAAGGPAGGGPRFNIGSMLNGGQPSALQTAVEDLQAAIDNPDTPIGVYESKLAEYRDAKAKADADMAAAQDALRNLLTQRQEAILVTMGLLQ
jgi:hypothetical protein